MSYSDVEAIKNLVARSAISDLLHGYARCVRAGETDAAMSLFTEDAVFEIRESAPAESNGYRVRDIFNGWNEIRAYVQKSAHSTVHVYPLIHNSIIEVKGNEAVSNSMMTAWILPMGKQLIGEYDDAYVNSHGWRFSRRIYTIISQSNNSAIQE